jgi:hypothetical protein
MACLQSKLLYLSIALGMLLSSGCSDKRNPVVGNQEATGTALLKIMASPGGPFTTLADSAVITITAPDMLTITKELTVTDSSVEGIVSGIPAGKDRLFAVAVFDSEGTMQYRGSAKATVVADSTVNVRISVVRLSGSAIINGPVVESDSMPMDGLVAYYPFNGNANDGSGNGNNGTIVNVVLSKDRFLRDSSAYNFAASTSKIILGNSSSLNPPQEITISAWINPKAAGAYQQDIISKHGAYTANSQSYLLAWDAGSPKKTIRFYISEDGQSLYFIYSKSEVQPNSGWHQIVGVFKGGAIFDIYLDNIKASGDLYFANSSTNIQSTKVIPARIASSSSSAQIGNWASGPVNNYFTGHIDDVRIYDRALSETEINTLFHEGAWFGN